MREILYSEYSQFILLDYSPSHSELILRSIGKESSPNKDIFFKGVKYIDICVRFDGLKISEIEKGNYNIHKNKYEFDELIKLFQLEDSSGNYFSIAAYYFCVFNNKLPFLTSPLGDFLWSEQNKQLYISP